MTNFASGKTASSFYRYDILSFVGRRNPWSAGNTRCRPDFFLRLDVPTRLSIWYEKLLKKSTPLQDVRNTIPNMLRKYKTRKYNYNTKGTRVSSSLMYFYINQSFHIPMLWKIEIYMSFVVVYHFNNCYILTINLIFK